MYQNIGIFDDATYFLFNFHQKSVLLGIWWFDKETDFFSITIKTKFTSIFILASKFLMQ